MPLGKINEVADISQLALASGRTMGNLYARAAGTVPEIAGGDLNAGDSPNVVT